MGGNLNCFYGVNVACACCAQFVNLRSLQNTLRDLAIVRIRARLGLGLRLG